MPSYVLSPAAKAMAHMKNMILPRMLQRAPATPAAKKAPAKKKKAKRAKKSTKSCSNAGRKLAKCK